MYVIRFLLFCFDAVNDFLSRNGPYIAGAISFYTMFSIFPLSLAVISILGFVLGPRAEQEQLNLAVQIADIFPVNAEFVSKEVQGIISARAITGIASVFGLLWAATAVFGAIRKGINAVWGVNRPRPFLKERLIDFALVLGAGVVMLLVLFAPVVLDVMKEIMKVVSPETQIFGDFFWRLADNLLFPILAFGTFLILYTLLPNIDVKFRHVWPVALLAALTLYGANLVFVWYVTNFALEHYNVLYGSVGAILAFLTWVYVTAIIVLLGALIASRYAAYASSLEIRKPSFRLLWTGFSRVRIRVVEYPKN